MNECCRIKRVFTSEILVSVLFLSKANATDKVSEKATTYKLRYVGKLQEQPIFQLDIENLQKEEVYICLKDEAGYVLYSQKFSERNFTKRFQFGSDETLTKKIKMTLISKSSRQTQIFTISNVQNLVERVVVTKVY